MSFKYQAGSWKKERRIIAKIEASKHGLNKRFLVTNNTCNSAKEAYPEYFIKSKSKRNVVKIFQIFKNI